MLISFAVIRKLVCAFVFAYANCWFSHAVDQMYPDLYIYSPETTFVVDEACDEDMVAEGSAVTMVTIDVALELDI